MEMNKEVEIKIGNQSVFGIFRNQQDLDRAVTSLKNQNFNNSDISVLMQSKQGTQDFAFEKHTKAPEGATTGAATGILAGGVLGWLVGAGALMIPGLGPFIAAGPIMAAIAGAGVGGTVGGITGGLIGLGIPEFEAKRYEGYIKDGGTLISIHVNDNSWEKKARKILEDCGATNIVKTTEKKLDSDETYYRSNQDFETHTDNTNIHNL